MAQKLRVFVSHSFDEKDREDIDRILAFLRLPRFHLEVVTAKSPEARGIGDKVERLVDWADVTLGLFTVRYNDAERAASLPSQFVISECSFAKGRYLDDERKGVHGFVENGIQHSDLGLATVRGEEFPVFVREDFRNGQTKGFEDFLLTLQKRYSRDLQTSPKRPYRQRELQKTVEIFRNGTLCFKNTVELLILDPTAVEAQPIEHELWLPPGTGQFPGIAKMGANFTKDRAQLPCFTSRVFFRGGAQMDKSIDVEVLAQTAQSIKFKLRFPFALKSNDSIRYQYIWSVCNAAAVFEEDLAEGEFNQVSIRSPHGSIASAQLKLKFERETRYGTTAELFSKEPYLLQTYTSREDGLSSSAPMPVKRTDISATWEIYRVDFEKLQGTAIVRWKPSSRATVQRDLDKANFRQLEDGSPLAIGSARGSARRKAQP